VHGRSSKYAAADDKAGSSGGGMGRVYPPLRDVLMGRLVVFRSKAGKSAAAVVEEGSSNPAVGDVDV